jgi:hypothetical protein
MPLSAPIKFPELPRDPPPDWRERILATLAGEGVTEPPYVPIWRLVLVNGARVFGLVFLSFSPIFIALGLIPFVSGQIFAILFPASLIAVSVIFAAFTLRPLRIAGRRSRVEFAGRNPSHAVKTARHPPIFYLRAFSFDEVASANPLKYWVAPTPEMTLILRMRRCAPVLAIATPNEGDSALGALRFHVSDARWEEVVKAIVPCCQLVVWVTGNTRGLNWEIQQLIGSLPPHRLLLWPHVNVEVANKLKIDWESTARRRNAEWLQFVDAHIDIFPKPLPRDVKNIRFVAFDADWTPIPIPNPRYPKWAKDAYTDPSGIVAGLHAFLAEKFR